MYHGYGKLGRSVATPAAFPGMPPAGPAAYSDLAVTPDDDDFWSLDVCVGAVVGIDTFGESAPAGTLFKHFGFTVYHVVAKVKSVLAE